MTRSPRLATLVFIAVAAAGCVTMSVSSHLEPGTDFTTFRTWDWGVADALPTGDPRLDNNAIFKDYLEGVLEKSLAERGLQRAAPGAKADLLVHYHASVNQRVLVNENEGCRGDNCRPSVIEYEQGTLVIDVMNAMTEKLVWRGWAQDSVQGIIDNQDVLDRKVDEAIRKMLAQMPPTR